MYIAEFFSIATFFIQDHLDLFIFLASTLVFRLHFFARKFREFGKEIAFG